MAMKNYQGAVDDYNTILFIDLDNNIVFAYRGLAQLFGDTERMPMPI
jgi:lipoprotein NlpI